MSSARQSGCGAPARQALRRWLGAAALLGLATCAPALADEVPEYRIKAAFVYNFMVFTEWPAEVGPTLTLCVHGADPFGKEIDGLHGKTAAGRTIAVQRRPGAEPLRGCQAVFFAASSLDAAPRLLDGLRGQPVLTMADTPGALRRGVALNMRVAQDKVAFEVNLTAARHAGLNLSSKLLRLAAEVVQ
jgi:YfiR/HmsC-like